jgi:DNA-binding transcriptional regulator YiaG
MAQAQTESTQSGTLAGKGLTDAAPNAPVTEAAQQKLADYGKGTGEATSFGSSTELPTGSQSGGEATGESAGSGPAEVTASPAKHAAGMGGASAGLPDVERAAEVAAEAGEAEGEAQVAAMKHHEGHADADTAVAAGITAATLARRAEATKYSLEQLQSAKRGSELADIDFGRKEDHLADEDFARLFAMSRTDFDALPQWKRQALKKKHHLF